MGNWHSRKYSQVQKTFMLVVEVVIKCLLNIFTGKKCLACGRAVW